MTTKRLLIIAIGVLVLLNIGTLLFLWMQRGERGGGASVGQFITHELQFTPEQSARFDVMKEAHHTSVDSLHRINRELHRQLFNRLSQPEDASVDSISTRISENEKQIDLITFRHFREVREMCTLEQQKKFDDIIQEVLRRLQPKKGPPPSRP